MTPEREDQRPLEVGRADVADEEGVALVATRGPGRRLGSLVAEVTVDRADADSRAGCREQQRPEIGGRPGVVDELHRAGLQRSGEGVGRVRTAGDTVGVESVGDVARRVGDKVVPSDQSAVGSDLALLLGERGELADDGCRILDEPADGPFGSVERPIVDQRRCGVDVRVVGEERAGDQRCVQRRRSIAGERLGVVLLVAEQCAVGQPSERDDLVAADHHHVLDAGVGAVDRCERRARRGYDAVGPVEFARLGIPGGVGTGDGCVGAEIQHAGDEPEPCQAAAGPELGAQRVDRSEHVCCGPGAVLVAEPGVVDDEKGVRAGGHVADCVGTGAGERKGDTVRRAHRRQERRRIALQLQCVGLTARYAVVPGDDEVVRPQSRDRDLVDAFRRGAAAGRTGDHTEIRAGRRLVLAGVRKCGSRFSPGNAELAVADRLQHPTTCRCCARLTRADDGEVVVGGKVGQDGADARAGGGHLEAVEVDVGGGRDLRQEDLVRTDGLDRQVDRAVVGLERLAIVDHGARRGEHIAALQLAADRCRDRSGLRRRPDTEANGVVDGGLDVGDQPDQGVAERRRLETDEAGASLELRAAVDVTTAGGQRCHETDTVGPGGAVESESDRHLRAGPRAVVGQIHGAQIEGRRILVADRLCGTEELTERDAAEVAEDGGDGDPGSRGQRLGLGAADDVSPQQALQRLRFGKRR